MKTIYCHKLKQELPALSSAPIPGPLGQFLLERVSSQAWQDWQKEQTILINEHRLKLFEPQARAFLHQELLAFFELKPQDWSE